jgi:hypothetical protein
MRSPRQYKASVARMENDKAEKEVELQEARNSGAIATQELSRANTVAEDRQNVIAKKEGEVQALEVVSIRLMNQIEQQEEQGCALLEERNAAITQTVTLQTELAKNKTELSTAMAWNESMVEGRRTSSPKLKQNSTATMVNHGPDVAARQWQPEEHEQQCFGASRMFPETPPVNTNGDSCSGSSNSAPPPSSSSAAPTPASSSSAAIPAASSRGTKRVPLPSSPATFTAPPSSSSASDVELHHRAVLANPLEHGGSGVERQVGVEKDFKMLNKAARDKGLFPDDANAHSGVGGKRSGTVQGSSAMPEEFLAAPAVPSWRQQLQLEANTSSPMAGPSSQWPPHEWGEERRAATARVGPDGEPDPQVRGTPVKALVSGLGTLKVGKKIRKKGSPGKTKRKAKRSPSPAAKTTGSSDTIMERADDAATGKEEAEGL